MRRLIAVLLALLTLAIAGVAMAGEYYYNEDIILEYWVKDDGTAAIMFSKDMSGKSSRDGYGVIMLDLVVPAEIDGHPVTELAFHAFNGLQLSMYQLRTVTLPASVVWVDDLASPFADLFNLEAILVEDGNPVYESRDGVLYNRQTGMLVRLPEEHPAEEYAIAEGTVAVAPHAIDGEALRVLHVPDSVTVFSDALACDFLEVLHLGAGVTAFAEPDRKTGETLLKLENLRWLKEIHVSADNPQFSSQDGVLLDKAGTTLLYYPVRREAAHYDIPATVTAVGEEAFPWRLVAGVHPLKSVGLGGGFVFEEVGEPDGLCYPLALTEEARQSMPDGGKFRKQWNSNYELVDPAAYKPSHDAAMLEARFPALKAGQPLWIEKKTAAGEGIDDKRAQTLNKIFAGVGYTAQVVSADPMLMAEGNVWHLGDTREVACQGLTAYSFPKELTLVVEVGSLADRWAVQNGFVVSIR